MRDFKLENGDLNIEGNQIVMVSDGDETAQRVVVTLSSRLLEFEPAGTLGLNQENLFGKYRSMAFAKQDIQEAIESQVPDVVSVDKIDMKPNVVTRDMTVNLAFTVQSGAQETATLTIGSDE